MSMANRKETMNPNTDGSVVTTPTDTEVPPEFAGRKLGLIGLLLACTLSLVGLVVSLVALIVSVRNGRKNPAAIAGIIIGAIATVVVIAGTVYIVGVLDGTVGVCAELGPGEHKQGIMTYTCGDDDAPH